MMQKIVCSIRWASSSIFLCAALSGCYQAHSDDDLRTVPVTNNPHIVPSSGLSNLSAFGY
ncbi:MAG: hypothetical protein NTZ52_05165 [Chlamydiae bacterium]|nr:hypothetical protein [Chlamydiota bacterium]